MSEVHVTDRQNSLIEFALLFLWGTMVDHNKYTVGGGEYKFSLKEIEDLLMSLDYEKEDLVEWKMRIMRDDV